MFLSAIQFFKNIKPRVKGFLFKFFYTSSNLKVGKNFQCDTFPSVLINKGAKIHIQDNVIFRRDVELRSHANAQINIDSNVRIDRGVRILAANSANIQIRTGARIGLYTVLNGGDSIYIGEKALISGFVYLQTSMHKHQLGKSIQEQGYLHAPVKLEDDVWIGTHAVILPNCTLGKGAVVGSNAVVTKSVNEGQIVGGVPAKILKERS